MFLKTLQLKGFKSFADATALELEPGVTVVVGPNGSGKSNVVDAIGWVLGAQAPSAVRSQKMDDVIFAGSSKRPALGRAEVSLTVDNTSGALPIDFTEVTITRTLFRNGDSEYALNGTPCRLLDITELLSDSGVGRQQHVIISQGQIDAVLNARPEDRRTIIEEAAGVLKYRRRKEKAERRLAATEANQTRIVDLLREVRRQLKPLERQADAARRYDSVVAELHAVKVHLAGREIARLRSALADHHREAAGIRTEERRVKMALAGLDARIGEVEAELASNGSEQFGDGMVRVEALRERARGLAALVAERRRGIERDRDAFVDQAVVASLADDRARVAGDLEAVSADQSALDAEAAQLRDAAARAEHERQQVLEADTLGEEPEAELAAVRAELSALVDAAGRAGRERQQRAAELDRRTTRRDGLRADQAEATRRTEELEAERARLEERREPLVSAAETAGRQLSQAEAEAEAAAAAANRWRARAEALQLALDQARSRAGAERLRDIEGVLGTVLDLIEVDSGWEQAVEAGLTAALDAVVVASTSTAASALRTLDADRLGGAVLSLDSSRALPAETPPRGAPIRPHVRARRPDVERLLDVLLGRVVAIEGDWAGALDAAMSMPTWVVVTRRGDRFAADGWRIGAATSGATGAALEEALAQAEATAGRHHAASAALTAARSAAADASSLAAQHDRAVASLDHQRAAHREHVRRIERELELAEAEVVDAGATAATAAGFLEETDRRRGFVEARLPALEAAAADRVARIEAAGERRRVVDERVAEVARQLKDVEVRAGAAAARRRDLELRVEQLEARLSRHAAERADAESRRLELDARAEVVARLAEFLDERLAALDTVIGLVRAARQRHSEQTRSVVARLESLRAERTAAEAELDGLRERLQRNELTAAETTIRHETAVEMIRTELDTEPETAVAALPPELPDGVTPHARARELERDLKAMGPINPLALEEFAALTERHDFLQGQLDDIRRTRRELSKVIHAVDEEIVSVFASAFADVATNFEQLFQTLFPGGAGSLRLTEPGDLLNTGIEVEAKPSGKNVKKLSLLSGGERSLTALAFLFAVFRSRPSPFYVMDEVEAALDDVNLHRFLGLVEEFRSTAQLVIVSHQKRTMEAADVLYGVTMEPGGSSKVLSERVSSLLE